MFPTGPKVSKVPKVSKFPKVPTVLEVLKVAKVQKVSKVPISKGSKGPNLFGVGLFIYADMHIWYGRYMYRLCQYTFAHIYIYMYIFMWQRPINRGPLIGLPGQHGNKQFIVCLGGAYIGFNGPIC